MGLVTDDTSENRLSASFYYSIGFWPAGKTNPVWLEGHKAAAISVAFLGSDKDISRGDNYSSARNGNSLVWGGETIVALFRVGPDELTPGSKMPMQRITGAQDRDDLVQYLKQATKVAAEVVKRDIE